MLWMQSGRGMMGVARRAVVAGLLMTGWMSGAIGSQAQAIGHQEPGQDWAMAEVAMPGMQLTAQSLAGEERLRVRATEGFRGLPLLGSWTALEEMSEPAVLLLYGFGLMGASGLCVAAAALRRGSKTA